MYDLLFEILKVAVGTKESISKTIRNEQWHDLLVIAQKQTVVGIVYEGIKTLNNKNITFDISREFLFQLIGIAEQIRQRNVLLYERCVELDAILAKDGFRSCVLKGQANALSYHNPYSRTPGDIDVWIEGDKKDVINYVRKRFPGASECDWNIGYPIFHDVIVEAHFKPQYLSTKKYDIRLQDYFKQLAGKQFNHISSNNDIGITLCTPTADFNIVLQLAHIIGHFFAGGIGMRHIVDLYYALRCIKIEKDNTDYNSLLSYLGMLKFTQGIMWVVKDTLGVCDELLIVEPSEKVGIFLLGQIIDGGNFGQYRSKGNLKGHNLLVKGYMFAERQARLFSIFPAEAVGQLIYVSKLVAKKKLKLN